MPTLLLADLAQEELWRRTRNIPDAMWQRNSARIARLRQLQAMPGAAGSVTVDNLSLVDFQDELEWRRGHQPAAPQWMANYQRTRGLDGLIADISSGRQLRSGGGDSSLVILWVILGIFVAAWLFLYS
jgi:hypothetical protein